MLHVTVLVAALLGQTIYTWTDKDGEPHYTDDPSTIPKGVKAQTMAPGEVETVRSSDEPAEKPSAVDAGAPPRDTCLEGREAVAAAEAALAAAKKAAAEPPPRDCQEQLKLLGHTAYAQCMSSKKDLRQPARAVADAEHRLEDAKDDLRRAQAAGCR